MPAVPWGKRALVGTPAGLTQTDCSSKTPQRQAKPAATSRARSSSSFVSLNGEHSSCPCQTLKKPQPEGFRAAVGTGSPSGPKGGRLLLRELRNQEARSDHTEMAAGAGSLGFERFLCDTTLLLFLVSPEGQGCLVHTGSQCSAHARRQSLLNEQRHMNGSPCGAPLNLPAEGIRGPPNSRTPRRSPEAGF